MSNITREEVRDRLGNVDQIRDLLFGAKLQEYERRFEQIESKLSEFQQEVGECFEDMKNDLALEIQSAVEHWDKRFQSFSTQTQEENKEMRQQIGGFNRKLSNSVESLEETIEEKTSELGSTLLENRQMLQEEIHTLRSDIFETLKGRAIALQEEKTSKQDIAEILFELTMRLKGEDVIPTLQSTLNPDFLVEILSE